MANPIFDKIIDLLEGLATLEVVTVVGPTTVTVQNEKLIVDVAPADSKAIESKINLATGDLCTKIDSEFVTGKLTAMRQFHNQQVTNGREIIETNFKVLTELGEKIGDKLTA